MRPSKSTARISGYSPMEYIDMTPTWEAAVRMHLMCIEHGDSEKAKQGAREELLRLGRAYDAVQSGFERVPD